MKKHYPSLLAAAFLSSSLLFSQPDYGQSIGVGTSTPNASAQLDISSTSRGLLIPRMTDAGIVNIASPAKGLMVYDTLTNQLYVNMGTPGSPNWQNIVTNSGWSLYGNNTGGYLGTLGANSPLLFMAEGVNTGKLDGSNVAFGNNAYQLNYTGTANVALGLSAMYQGTGSNSVAIGQNALYENYGIYNIGIGEGAGFEMSSGRDNIAMGRGSMGYNTVGSYNIGIGAVALGVTSSSEYNTVVGFNSAQAYNMGYNNVILGANNDVNGAGYYNVIAIGQGVICTASSQARIGNSATNSIGGYADWTNFSDVRYKKNIREGVKGLDFIMRLRPITYNLDVTGIRNHLGQRAPTDAGTQQSITARESELLTGFAAQEVEAAAVASGYEFSGVDKPKNANDFYGLRYGDFVVPLVKAVQEQQQMIEALQKQVTALQEQNKLLMEQINKK
jgi:trimeric autotransporter adhesin